MYVPSSVKGRMSEGTAVRTRRTLRCDRGGGGGPGKKRGRSIVAVEDDLIGIRAGRRYR